MKKVFLVTISLVTAYFSMIIILTSNQAAFNYILNSMPDRIQYNYINYVLNPNLGFFRNCQIKLNVFVAIRDQKNYGFKLNYNKRLLSGYAIESDRDFPVSICNVAMEPFPYIARTALFEDGGVLFKEIVHEEEDEKIIKKYCDVYRRAVLLKHSLIEIEKCVS